jgi:menaquinone-dependent protoporphyrinogen IX oxidase
LRGGYEVDVAAAADDGPEDDVAASRKQLDQALAAVPELTPVAVTIFGGAVDPSKLRFPFKRTPASDARDWDAIGAWSRELSVLFANKLETVWTT